MALGMQYNPSAVMMGQPQAAMRPYVNPKGPRPVGPEPIKPRPPGASPTPPPSTTVGPESIRATGAGPYDQAYRQNLATYAGGQFARPGGSMSFNPTDTSTFPGQPTGGGNAPVSGMPNTLLDEALGGQSFSWNAAQPTPSKGTPSGQATMPSLQDWLKQFLMNGSLGPRTA